MKQYDPQNSAVMTGNLKDFLEGMVGRPRFERGTNGLKVRCSTDWANDPSKVDQGNGGSSAIRTRDQRIKSPLLYQLS